MKINGYVVLVLFLIALLTLAVASQINQIPSSISLEEGQSCNTVFYNEIQDVNGYVSREKSVYGNCLYYHNYTSCLNTSGANTVCSIQQRSYNFACINGTEQYQSYEKVGTKTVLKNTTECTKNKYIVSVAKGAITEKKEIDFSNWGVCVNTTENNCLAIICGSQHGGSAVNGIFNGCDGGKSCQKFLFCKDEMKVLYKASRNDFVEEDPTFHLTPLVLKEAGQ